MRKVKWFVSTKGEQSGCGPNFADSKPKDGWTRREYTNQPEGAEAEKALFRCRTVDFEQNIAYLKSLVDRSEFSDRNRERMLEAVGLLEEAKQTMASIITDEVAIGVTDEEC